MKKALFKPNSKIGENFEYSKLNDMLLKKINYFYKTYIRFLKKLNGVSDNTGILDLIEKDVEDYKESSLEKYKLTASNLGEKYYEDLDLKNIMIVEFFRSLKGRNPFLKVSMQEQIIERYMNQAEIDEQTKENFNKNKITGNTTTELDDFDDYYSFNDLSLKDKVEVIFFFCNYALTFSGRASYFREELMKDSKDPLNIHTTYKRVSPLGKDSESNNYYSVLFNKDCRIYKEKEDSTLELVVKNYTELEQFINSLEAKAVSNPNLPECNLLKNIHENLLSYKENDDEEQKKEIAFKRKQQIFEKAKKLENKPSGEVEKYQQSDYFLMNMSDHVITRNQLNQITKVNTAQANLNNSQINKPQVVTEDDKKRIKVEKEKLERQKRLEKRNRHLTRLLREDEALDEKSSSDEINLNKKRGRSKRLERLKVKIRVKRNSKKRNESSEDEYESSENFSDNSQQRNVKISEEMNLDSDREDHHEGEYMNENNFNTEEDTSSDIIIEGNMVYRYSSNQIELEGMWYMNTDPSIKERVSYLFLKSNEYTECYINKEGIQTDTNAGTNPTPYQRDYRIKICSANLIECILLNKIEVFDLILNLLSGEYAGYFMYYGKTIEDRVNLNLSFQDSLVRISGKKYLFIYFIFRRRDK